MTGLMGFVTRDLLIVGAGGFAREAAAAVQAINDQERTWNLLGLLDDDPVRHGTTAGGVEVIGPVDLVHDHPDAAIVICTGRPGNYTSRRAIAGRLDLPDERYAKLLHPSAAIAGSSRVGVGSVILANVTATTDVVVGRHVAIMPQVVLTHDVQIGDWATLASGVTLGGGVLIRDGAYLGSGVLVREGSTIGAWSLIGMGSMVLGDVPPGRVWFGSPARDVRAADAASEEVVL